MQKKEAYRHILPHFQQPGQAYFVTWCLKDAIPAKVVEKYSKKLALLKHQIDFQRNKDRDRKFSTSENNAVTNRISQELKKEYFLLRRSYFKAFDSFLDIQKKTKIDLSKKDNLLIMHEVLNFWQGKKLNNEAFCVMPNHVHWGWKFPTSIYYAVKNRTSPVKIQIYPIKKITGCLCKSGVPFFFQS